MLETRISSTARIAHAWGLATEAEIAATETVFQTQTTDQPKPQAAPSLLDMARLRSRWNRGETGSGGTGTASSAHANKISKVINDALRAAGLLR